MNAVPVDTVPPRKRSWWRWAWRFLLGAFLLLVAASFLFPCISQCNSVAAEQTKALFNARQIVGALRTYASDHDGKFPDVNPDGSPITSANQAFRALFPQYLTSEQLFYARNQEGLSSAWSPARPDNKLDAPGERPGTNTLRPGENHFAYVRGLTDSSNAQLPFVADGFTSPAGGIIPDPVYSGSPKEKGGIWAGRVAIVVHIDQSAEKLRLTSGERVFRVMRRLPDGTPGTKNLFSADPSDPSWLQPGQGAVDPE